MKDQPWGVWFEGNDDEEPGICVESNRPLIFTGEEAETQAREALTQLLAGSYGWKPAWPERYKAVPVSFAVCAAPV